MKKIIGLKACCILLGVFTLSACVTINRFQDMVALVNGNEVAFTLPESDLTDKDTRFMLNGIGVTRRDDCVKDCSVWVLVRPLESNVDLIEENFVTFPIKYGVTLPNMQTKVLKVMQKGRYTATASIAMIKDGKVVDSKKMIVGFTIEK